MCSSVDVRACVSLGLGLHLSAVLQSVGPASLWYLIRLMSVINPGDLVLLSLPSFLLALPLTLFWRSDFIKAVVMKFSVSVGSWCVCVCVCVHILSLLSHNVLPNCLRTLRLCVFLFVCYVVCPLEHSVSLTQ